MDHFEAFEQKIQEIDHRLSTIILQAFHDCSGIEGMFKVSLIVRLQRLENVTRVAPFRFLVVLRIFLYSFFVNFLS